MLKLRTHSVVCIIFVLSSFNLNLIWGGKTFQTIWRPKKMCKCVMKINLMEGRTNCFHWVCSCGQCATDVCNWIKLCWNYLCDKSNCPIMKTKQYNNTDKESTRYYMHELRFSCKSLRGSELQWRLFADVKQCKSLNWIQPSNSPH